MSIADVAEDGILKLVFQAVAWANFADNTLTSPQTNTGISLHTGDPGESGDATTNEVTTTQYQNYTRQNVLRQAGAGGWTYTPGTGAAAGSMSPTSAITFPAGGAASTGANVQFFATAKSNAAPPTGTQALLWTGSVSPQIAVGNGVTPQLTTSTTITLQ